MTQRAVLTVTSGPNEGDTVSLEVGSCRLVGRHLSETETVLIDRDGNRLLDGQAAQILSEHLKDRAPAMGVTPLPDSASTPSSVDRTSSSPTTRSRAPTP